MMHVAVVSTQLKSYSIINFNVDALLSRHTHDIMRPQEVPQNN